MAENFYETVYNLVKQIPRGRVTTYGQIAALLGKPQAARLVGWALSTLPPDIPWQRVVNRHGMISINNRHISKAAQAALLTKDKVKVSFKNGNYWIDLKHYLWKN